MVKQGDLIWGELCCVLSRGRKGVKSSAWRGMGVESSHITPTPRLGCPTLVGEVGGKWELSSLPPSLPRYSPGASWVPGVQDTTGKKQQIPDLVCSCGDRVDIEK